MVSGERLRKPLAGSHEAQSRRWPQRPAGHRAGHRGQPHTREGDRAGWVCLCESTCPGQRACPCAGGRWTETGALLGPGNKVTRTKSLLSGSSLSGQPAGSRMSGGPPAPRGPQLNRVPYLPLVQISKRACSCWQGSLNDLWC